jgi:hypothetical protein
MLLASLAAAAIAAYAAMALWYLRLPTFYDHAEPTVASIAWLFATGQPIYHAPDAAARYSHMYGPLAFMVPAWCLEIVGTGIAQAKSVGIAAGLLTVLLVYRLARSATGTVNAVMLTGFFALEALMFRNVSFWIRPDALVTLFAAVALLGSSRSNPVAAALVVGAATGVLVNLKLTGVLYALPAIALLAARHGTRRLSLAGIVGIAVLAWPFVAFGNVSFANFRYWTQVSASNGLAFTTLRANLEWAAFLLVPLAPLVLADGDTRLARQRRWGLGGLAAGVAVTVIAASKPGAGSSHVLPFLPAVLYLIALGIDAVPERVRRQSAFRHAAVAVPVVAFVIAFCQQSYFITGATETSRMDLTGDLARFADQHPVARIAMGAGDSGARLTYVRPLLVFRSGFYPIDVPAVQEYQMSGLELPEATLQGLASCRSDFWLVPKGGVPFANTNIYPSTHGVTVFPERFRQMFAQHYERDDDTQYFQVWRCREDRRVTDR